MPHQRAKVKEKYRPKSTRLMDQVREVLRYHHYAIRTEEAYVKWILKFIRFHGTRHPREMGKSEIKAFLSHLAINRHVAASTQNQAMNGILFLYREVLHLPMDDKIEAVRSRKPKRLPTVLSRVAVAELLNQMSGRNQLMAKMLYGSGMRLMEVVRLRVQDLDFDNHLIIVRDGKGNKDRSTLFPEPLHTHLDKHLEAVKTVHDEDLSRGYGRVYLPSALCRKFPHAAHQGGWQYVFPAGSLSRDRRSEEIRRHHIDETTLQKAISAARGKAGIGKRVSCHCLRHYAASRIMPNEGFGLLCVGSPYQQ